jgi:hypothetical protein
LLGLDGLKSVRADKRPGPDTGLPLLGAIVCPFRTFYLNTSTTINI